MLDEIIDCIKIILAIFAIVFLMFVVVIIPLDSYMCRQKGETYGVETVYTASSLECAVKDNDKLYPLNSFLRANAYKDKGVVINSFEEFE